MNDEHDDSESERRKKASKQKWVPLDIDLKGGNKRDGSPKQRSESQPANLADGEQDSRSDNNNTNNKHTRPSSAASRGRGRNRGGRRTGYNRPTARMPSEPDYQDFTPQDFVQVSKFGVRVDVTNFIPYLGTYYYNSNSYVNLDSPTLKTHIKHQM